MKIDERQMAEYRERGFTRLGRILDEATLEAIRREEERLRLLLFGPVPSGPRTVFMSQVCHISEPARLLCTGGPQIDAGVRLVGPDLCLWYNQFVTKLPDAGTQSSAFPWHQDNGYVPPEPQDNMTVWVALDDVDEQNGCIYVKPGSHRLGLLPHRRFSADVWHLQVDAPGPEEAVPMRAGEAIAFTGLTVHCSKLNLTDKPRRAFFMEYSRADAYLPSLGVPVIASQHSWLVRGRSTLPPDPAILAFPRCR